MKVAYATNLAIIFWLLLATLYYKNSHGGSSHKPWGCLVCSSCNTIVTQNNINTIVWYCTKDRQQHVCIKFLLASPKHKWNTDNYVHNSNNVFLCSKKNCLNYSYSKIHTLSYTFNTHTYSFSTTNSKLGSPIKWWEEVGYETQRSNDMLNATHELGNIPSKCYSKISMHALYRFIHMAEASSTKNMDVCIVAENEITNTSQKRIPSALVTITQKKAKTKKSLGVKGLSLWLGFQALNHINKQKDLPIETMETTRELLKKKHKL